MECLYRSSQIILDRRQEIDAVELGKEQVMYERISSTLLDNIDPLQYGFHPKVGTIESVKMLNTALPNRLSRKKDPVLFH